MLPQRRLPISYHAAPLLLAIGQRCEAGFGSEAAVEVAEVLEARYQRNFGDCVPSGLQQRGGTPDAKPENPLRRCLPKVGAERPAQMGYAAAGHARQLRWTPVKRCIVPAELYQGVVQPRRHCTG